MTNPTPAGDRTRRLKAIGWLTAGGTLTVALTAAGLSLITAPPTTHPAPSTTTPTISTSPTQNLPAPTPATGTTQQPVPTVSPSAATSTGHGDPMAGAIPDSLIQRTLDEASLTTVDATTAKTTRAIAWTALAADLQAGGWSHPHLQGASVAAPGNDQTAPTIVDVTAIWCATTPAGQPVDRQRSIVRLTSTSGRWAVERIT
ncbi:hypothetical protein AB0F43_31755 [Kribbella sp. NPDC023972]|uniref:hypothetical protein n=1 Tax=Kribbella sp. NPDC023972 TaxID=3154795 RepID=UPI0033F11386